jgi:hypothetical protein
MVSERRHLSLARQFAGAGMVGLVLAADMLLLRRLFDGSLPPAIHQLTSPMVKTPPSPAFICFNLGIGLLVLSAALAASVHQNFAKVVRALSVVGQASLFVFVIEYFIYDFTLYELHARYTPMWPLLFVFLLGIIWSLAAFWTKHGFNRFLTVGYCRSQTVPAGQPVWRNDSRHPERSGEGIVLHPEPSESIVSK